MAKVKEVALMAIAVFLFAAFCFSSARATTGAYSYALPGYTATYDLVKMPPPDSGAINPYAYNIVVYGPPPYPILISFNEQTQGGNGTQQMNMTQPTDSYSLSIGCTSYPTQITMQFVYSGATVTPSPFPSPTPYPISGSAPGVSVPEFTLALVSHPYDVPATSPNYTTNPYTGAQEQVSSGSAGYNVQNSTIQLSIRNQRVSYSDGSMNFTTFYNIRVKGYFSQNWTEISFLDENPSIKTVSTPNAVLVVESSSDYTVVPVPASNFPDDGKVDFQVQAILGCYNTTWVWDTPTIFNMYEQWYVGNPDCGSYQSSFVTESTSDWSNTQTLNLTDGSVYGSTQITSALSPSPTSPALENPSPNLPSTPNQAYASLSTSQFNIGWVEVAASATLVMVVALLVAIIVFMHRKIRVLEKKPNDKGND